MKKLFIEKDNNKFVNNILLSPHTSLQLFGVSINQNLYEIFYKTNFDACIFMASKFDAEKLQFINEFIDTNMRIYLYHNTLNESLLDLQHKNLIHLIEHYVILENNAKHKNTIVLPPLINKNIFFNNKNNKNNIITCFIDHISSIPNSLLAKLYPNTKLPIKLFNNPTIKHHQNLGLVNEEEKAHILNQSEYYLSINHYYAAEASEAGCKILDIAELDDMKEQKYKHIKNPQTYSRYIEKLL